MANTKKANFKKYLTLFIVALAGGIITKLPYLRETYMEPLSQATGATYTSSAISQAVFLQISSAARR